jgi:hypothetical protein
VTACGCLCAAAAAAAVNVAPLGIKGHYPDAVAPGAFGLACAGTAVELNAFFAAKGLPFDERIVRRRKGEECHILYEPTVKGLRALPENSPVSELFLDILLPGFLSLRSERFGDVLDIARQMLPLIRRPIRVNLGMPQNHEAKYYQQALRFHFPAAPHAFAFRDNRTDQKNPWVQDFFKSGVVNGTARALVTRLAFEGRVRDGALMKPMLDSLEAGRFERSKLSWEGGDLQFMLSPKDPRRLLLFYGKSARTYWGSRLSPEEYEYVLKLEFGADEAADLSDVTSHVDYFVGFLPEDGIALVSQPERENLEIARAAARVLADHYRMVGQAEVIELERMLADKERAFGRDLPAVRALLRTIAARSPDWPIPFDGGVAQRLHAYVERACSGNPMDCASPDEIGRLLAREPALLRDWAKGSTSALTTEVLASRIVSIIESQLPGFEGTVQPIVDRYAKKLESLGFRVVRVPRLAGDPVLKPRWPGVSYVNAILIDRTLFMPEFGLGEAEWALFDRVRAAIPAKYRVVPVYARHVLLYNGGLHCISGLIRTADAAERQAATSAGLAR